jgi:hypothetical protein
MGRPRKAHPGPNGKGSNRRLEFQLCAWFVGSRGFGLVGSTARPMEQGLSAFGRGNHEDVLLAVATIHHVVDRPRILHSHGARHESYNATLPSLVKHGKPAHPPLPALPSGPIYGLTPFLALCPTPVRSARFRPTAMGFTTWPATHVNGAGTCMTLIGMGTTAPWRMTPAGRLLAGFGLKSRLAVSVWCAGVGGGCGA